MVQTARVTQGTSAFGALSPLGRLCGAAATTHGGGGVRARPLSLSLCVGVDEQRRCRRCGLCGVGSDQTGGTGRRACGHGGAAGNLLDGDHVVAPLVKDGCARAQTQDHGVERVHGRQRGVW